MKVLLICPIPMEYTACREVLALRDTKPLMGCRIARGSVGTAEVLAIESGPAKARAAAATTAACIEYKPDIVVDTGSCCSLEPGGMIGQIILGQFCYEYDIGGDKIPRAALKTMQLPSGFYFMDRETADKLVRRAVMEGKEGGFFIRVGSQACGEVLVQSLAVRQHLHDLFHASGANWETAGVFVGALKNGMPPFSLRVVTDLGDQQALGDFKRNVRSASRQLYHCLESLLKSGWFLSFFAEWKKTQARVKADLAAAVRP